MDNKLRRQFHTIFLPPIDAEDFDITKLPIQVIFFALLNINRFAGNFGVQNNVLEHTIDVVSMVRTLGGGPIAQAQAMLHEAMECVIGDIPSWVKRMSPEICAYEEEQLGRLFKHYGLPEKMLPVVKEADDAVLQIEKERFNSVPKGDIEAVGMPGSREALQACQAAFASIFNDAGLGDKVAPAEQQALILETSDTKTKH